jgi:hypothetical protein
MAEEHYIIRFEDTSAAEASAYADELRDRLLDESENIQAEIRREDPNKQDFGAILDIVLNADAIVPLATAIGVWLKFRHSASITIQSKDGKTVIKNLNQKDAARLAEKLLTRGDDSQDKR